MCQRIKYEYENNKSIFVTLKNNKFSLYIPSRLDFGYSSSFFIYRLWCCLCDKIRSATFQQLFFCCCSKRCWLLIDSLASHWLICIKYHISLVRRNFVLFVFIDSKINWNFVELSKQHFSTKSVLMLVWGVQYYRDKKVFVIVGAQIEFW
jgi:hypothetical protein